MPGETARFSHVHVALRTCVQRIQTVMPEQDVQHRDTTGNERPSRLNTREILELVAMLMAAASADDKFVESRLGSLHEEIVNTIMSLAPVTPQRMASFRFLDIEQAHETVTILVRPNDRNRI